MTEGYSAQPLNLDLPRQRHGAYEARRQETALTGMFDALAERKVNLIVPAGAYHFNNQGQHVAGLNETRNYGIGVAVQTSQTTEAFVTAYRSSYADTHKYRGDVAVVAGVNWDPVKVDMGALRLKAGLMGGVAYTTHGSYAETSPELSAGKFTALGGLHGEALHKPTGLGVGVTILPPLGGKNQLGVAALYLKKEF